MMAAQLAPGFLVASPALLDPNFHRSVVLLIEHRPEGSLGFVINRPAELKLVDTLDALGLKAPDAGAPDAPVLVGGPVAPETGWIVFEQAPQRVNADQVVRISETMAVSASRDLLASVVREGNFGRFMLVLGYAGWGAGQLDAEIAQGAWIPVDLDARIVFDAPYEQRWSAALRSLGIDPARLSPHAPYES